MGGGGGAGDRFFMSEPLEDTVSIFRLRVLHASVGWLLLPRSFFQAHVTCSAKGIPGWPDGARYDTLRTCSPQAPFSSTVVERHVPQIQAAETKRTLILTRLHLPGKQVNRTTDVKLAPVRFSVVRRKHHKHVYDGLVKCLVFDTA